ncbi:MAG: UDP-N-acetylmuramate dehydrogenase [Puniceicoccales bacterium]|jgi:UDP-N-acetylenolpyruvoylglucosamine reductase|nr:UDP-N-acetylmuramate dehydrogenase [Puniceicoccales bacterium]
MKPPSRERIFMAGIGGAGMTALAIFLRGRGAVVFGFDDFLDDETAFFLGRWGIHTLGRPAELPPCDVVIHTMAIGLGDPLLRDAHRREVAVYSRGAYLAQILREQKLLAIVGSHGKTTTTAMVVGLLMERNFPFNYLLGGRFAGDLPPASYVGAPWTVAEIDESEASMELFSPHVTLALNLSMDHDSHYGTLENLQKTFLRFFARTVDRVFFPFGEESLRCFSELHNGHFLRDCLPRSGERLTPFNRTNYMAAAAVADYLCTNFANSSPGATGMDFSAKVVSSQKIEKNSLSWPAVWRRQTQLFSADGTGIMADYAHHPKEIEAFLGAYSGERSLTIFQPHRYSRTVAHGEEFLKILQNSPHAVLMPTYGAFESFDGRGTAEGLAEELAERRCPVPCLSDQKLFDYLDNLRGRGAIDLFLFVGAGPIFSTAVAYGNHLRAERFRKLSHLLCPELQVMENIPMSSMTTLRIGGPARFFAEPETLESLRRLLHCARLADLKYFIIGAGSNLLVGDSGYGGLVLRLQGNFWKHCVLGADCIRVGAGLPLKRLADFCREHSIGGFEFCSGIPGTMGGAVLINAGAFGSSIGEFVRRIEYVDGKGEEGQIHWPKFFYRRSPLLRGSTVTAVELVRPGNPIPPCEIGEKMEQMAAFRKELQPRQPSAGSTFRNPKSAVAGKLIEETGLKGLRRGGAEISPVHGNFIVNGGGASCGDVLELIFTAQEAVAERFKIDLETEVCFLADFWEGSF